MSRPQPYERAQAWLAKAAPEAGAGARNDTAFVVALTFLVDFNLPEGDAEGLLNDWNRRKCSPPLDERELGQCFRSAARKAANSPDKGKLLEQDAPGYTGPRLPPNGAGAPPRTARTGGAQARGSPPQGGGTARTLRTPLFQVHHADLGAKPAPTRTVRTLPPHSFTHKVKETDENKRSEPEASAVSAPVRDGLTRAGDLVPVNTPWREGQRYRAVEIYEVKSRLECYVADAAGPWIWRNGALTAVNPRIET